MPIRTSLTPAQIDEFYENGFVTIPDFWSPAEVAEMKEAFWRLHEAAQKLRTTQLYKGSSFVLKDHGHRVAVLRVVWCGAAEPILLERGADPRLLTMAAQLLGSREMDQLINQAHFKMPEDGVSFPWHQDIQHRDKKPGDWRDANGRGSYVQTFTTLDDMTADNGPMIFLPGSNRQGRIAGLGSGDYSSGHHDEGEGAEPVLDESKGVPMLAPAGSLILFGPYTVHGSFANKSNSTRFSFLNGYAFPGANSRVYPGEGSGRRLVAPPEAS